MRRCLLEGSTCRKYKYLLESERMKKVVGDIEKYIEG